MNAKHIEEMMKNWIATEAASRTKFPEADAETIYQMVSAAMNKSLGL